MVACKWNAQRIEKPMNALFVCSATEAQPESHCAARCILSFAGHYAAVKDFIDHSASGISNLEVEYVRGQTPQLVLMSDALEEPEILSIGSWKEEHILEFLQSKLRL